LRKLITGLTFGALDDGELRYVGMSVKQLIRLAL
jgi:hypothetical protein